MAYFNPAYMSSGPRRFNRVVSERRARQNAENAALYRMANPELIYYLERKVAEVLASGRPFDFPQKMLDAISRFGSLTDGQKAAVERIKAGDEARALARAAQASAPRSEPIGIDASKIEAAFARSRREAIEGGDVGVKYPKIVLSSFTIDPTPGLEEADAIRIRASFTFKPAPAHGKNPGAIYVNEGQTYLGKIVGGKFLKVRECSDEKAAMVADVAKDPSASAKAYGLKYKHCSICGRELTNAESRARGIGPICAGRFGFFFAEEVFAPDTKMEDM